MSPILNRQAPLPRDLRERYEASNTALCMRCGAVMEHTVPSFVTCTIGGHDAIIEGVAQFVPERRVQLSGVPVYSCPACGLVETEAMRRAKYGPIAPAQKKKGPRAVTVLRPCRQCRKPFDTPIWSKRQHCSDTCATITRRETRQARGGWEKGGPMPSYFGGGACD